MRTLIIIGCVILFAGCDAGTTTEIITDPNNITAMETAAEGAVGLTQALGALWPALIPVGTAAGGLLAMYKRLKPKVIEATKSSDKYFAGGKVLADVLDDIKKNEPDLWEEIGPRIDKAKGTVELADSAIRGFRGV